MAQNITDEELERDWKPNGRRPQSTIARSFSAELMDIFRIENSVADLDEKLDKRKHSVQTHNTELESLERRIREMEERLKGGSSSSSHPRPALPTHPPPAHNAGQQNPADDDAAPPPPPPKDDKTRSRPGTARQNQPPAPSSANMPPTPTASEGEYDFVGGDDLDSDPAPSHPRR